MPFFQITEISNHAIELLAAIAESHYNDLIHNVEEIQLFVNAIKQIKSDHAKLAVDTSINFGRPMISNKLLEAAMQGLNELLDASSVCKARIAAAQIISNRVFCRKQNQVDAAKKCWKIIVVVHILNPIQKKKMTI